MDTDDPRSARRDHLLHTVRIKVARSRIDITKDRRDRLPLQGVGRADKRERGHKDLTGEIQGTDRDLQGQRSIAGSDAMSNTNKLSNALLELLYVRAIIGKPTAVEDVIDPLLKPLPISDIGRADVKGLLEGGAAAKDSQVFQA